MKESTDGSLKIGACRPTVADECASMISAQIGANEHSNVSKIASPKIKSCQGFLMS